MTISEESEQLAAELHALYRAGSVSIPLIANQFVDANGKVNQTRSKSKAAFTQISGDVSQVHDLWAETRDKLQTYMGKSGEHMHNIGGALIETMNNYKDQDAAAATELDRLIKENESYDGDLINPDDVPKYKDPVFPE